MRWCTTSIAGIIVALLGVSAARAAYPSVNGVIQTHAAARTTDISCPAGVACDFPSEDVSGQLKVEGSTADGSMSFLARGEILRDFAFDETRSRGLELYGDSVWSKASLRAGRQILTWGVGDLLFINDTFPKDFNAFFSGRPLEKLKLGSDAAKLSLFPGPVSVDLVAARFRPDKMPEPRRFIFDQPAGNPTSAPSQSPGSNIHDLDLSARVLGTTGSWEIAGYASRTHWRTAALVNQDGMETFVYPRLNTYGFSVTGPVKQGVLSIEAGYYDSQDNRNGAVSGIQNSQGRVLLGYSRQPWEDGTFGLQWYEESMRNYGQYIANLPMGMPSRPERRQVVTTRFTQSFWHQTLTANFFAFWGISEHDRLLNPSVRYAVNDSLWIEVGGNVFAGDRKGMFGSLGDNDNVYLTIRQSF